MSRNRILKELEIANGNTNANLLEIKLSYDLGGWNLWTGEKENRGIYIHVSPVEKGDGWTSFVAFTGIKMCVKELKRFNKKTFEAFVPEQKDIDRLVNHVLTENKIILKEKYEKA